MDTIGKICQDCPRTRRHQLLGRLAARSGLDTDNGLTLGCNYVLDIHSAVCHPHLSRVQVLLGSDLVKVLCPHLVVGISFTRTVLLVEFIYILMSYSKMLKQIGL